MPIVSIRLAAGRDIQLKRRLVAEVTRAVAETLDLPSELVSIQIEEFARENWATGGQLHLDKFGPGFGAGEKS
jgi:4-oxalocrotonate tautomerase